MKSTVIATFEEPIEEEQNMLEIILNWFTVARK